MLTDDSCSVSGLPIPSPASDDRQIIDSQIDRFISYMEVLPSLKTKSTKTTKRSFTYFEKGNTTKICWYLSHENQGKGIITERPH